MAEVKIVIGDKSGKSYQKIIESQDQLIGRTMGESIKGDLIDLPGYELLVTGGSDATGVPMRKEISGSRKVKILAHSGTGVKVKDKGIFIRKTVAGNTIGEKTSQINLKVSKEGTKKLEEIFGSKKETTEENTKKPLVGKEKGETDAKKT
jgi:small subunit ribosomal protein S6e